MGKTKITVMGFALTVAVQRFFIQNEKDTDKEKNFSWRCLISANKHDFKGLIKNHA